LLQTDIDHIVVTAPNLEEGVAYVQETLVVSMEPGGEHAVMGTHNALLRLGEKLYLEVIAPNPNAPSPVRPRWFDLDSTLAPGLATWIARTNDIHAAVESSAVQLGTVQPMSRGQFEWLITIPPDGSLPFHGIAPLLIQWLSADHPASRLRSSGCSLVQLEAYHPSATVLSSQLDAIGFEGNFSITTSDTPGLIAHIETPTGIRALRKP
jgi:Glyoxalase-like domain